MEFVGFLTSRVELIIGRSRVQVTEGPPSTPTTRFLTAKRVVGFFKTLSPPLNISFNRIMAILYSPRLRFKSRDLSDTL